MYEGVSDIQLRALGYDDQQIRAIRANSIPPLGGVERQVPPATSRYNPADDVAEAVNAPARPPVGPGTASPGAAGPDTLAEQDARRAIQDVNRRLSERPTKETNEYVDRLTAGDRARAIAATRQQRFRNENTRGLVDRNPPGARSTPWGQHPLDKERVPESRVATPAVPPEEAVGAGEKAQWYANRNQDANRMRPADAGTKPPAQPKSRLIVRGEEFDPNAEDPKMGWRTGSLKVSDAIARGDIAAARAMNERLPPSEQIPIPNARIASPPVGPSAEGLERIAESKRRKSAADQLIMENAMANRASRKNRMGLVNPYISPEIRTLHRMGDDERDARAQTLADKLALERERIAANQGTVREQLASQEKIAQGQLEQGRNRDQAEADWRKQQSADALAGREAEFKYRAGAQEAQLKEAQRQEARIATERLLAQRDEARRVYETQAQFAKNRPGDVDAADAAEQARRQLENIDARIRSYDQNYQPVQTTFGGQQGSGQPGGQKTAGAPEDYKRAWAAFNRHVQEDARGNVTGMRPGSTPEGIVKSIVAEMGTDWMTKPENEQIVRDMFARMPGGSDAYRIARNEEQWRDFWNQTTKVFHPERDRSWAPAETGTPGRALMQGAMNAGRSLPGGMGLPFWLPDIMGWANSQP